MLFRSLRTDDKAVFDNEIEIDVSKIKPQVTWGTSPEMVVNFDDPIPTIIDSNEENKKNVELARSYMGIQNESKLSDLIFDKVFIGSCTNSRIEDLRQAAEIVKGKTIAENISEAIVVPGSGLVKEQAENEGLDKVFTDAGFIWRDPGCSMCLGMNPDQLKPHERCASTSNRNFEGRQGNLGRTHLMSPIMAAFTAINGYFLENLPGSPEQNYRTIPATRNGGRYPSYHRLDVGAVWHRKKFDLTFQVINLYNRKNVFTYTYPLGNTFNGIDDDGDWKAAEHDKNNNGRPDKGEPNVDEADEGRIQRNPVSLFPMIPTIGINWNF